MLGHVPTETLGSNMAWTNRELVRNAACTSRRMRVDMLHHRRIQQEILAFHLCRTMPMRPDQLTGIAEREKYGVTVFKRKQLPVRPGLSERELGAMLQAYSIGA